MKFSQSQGTYQRNCRIVCDLHLVNVVDLYHHQIKILVVCMYVHICMCVCGVCVCVYVCVCVCVCVMEVGCLGGGTRLVMCDLCTYMYYTLYYL